MYYRATSISSLRYYTMKYTVDSCHNEIALTLDSHRSPHSIMSTTHLSAQSWWSQRLINLQSLLQMVILSHNCDGMCSQ